MDGALKIWIVIVAVGALNYASRLSFIAFFASREMPPLLARALKFVPAAILAAIVAYFTHSTLKTLGVGMAALWLLQAAAR